VKNNLAIRRDPNFMRGSKKKERFCSILESFVVTWTSQTVVILLRVSEYKDIYSSPRALVMSIPEFIFFP
jgi:hypothetical protein